jgi:hypothetical protein
MSMYARTVEDALKCFGPSKKRIHPFRVNPAKAVKLNVPFRFFLLRVVPKLSLAGTAAVVQDAPVVLAHPVIPIKLHYQCSYLTSSSRFLRTLILGVSAG